MSRPITIEEMTKYVMQTLEDVVTESYPPEERAKASAILLNLLSRSMFQGPEEKE
jgi:hypothetical protein